MRRAAGQSVSGQGPPHFPMQTTPATVSWMSRRRRDEGVSLVGMGGAEGEKKVGAQEWGVGGGAEKEGYGNNHEYTGRPPTLSPAPCSPCG